MLRTSGIRDRLGDRPRQAERLPDRACVGQWGGRAWASAGLRIRQRL